MSSVSQSPEVARLRQSKYRSRQRDRGFELVNKWIHSENKDDVYQIIDRINDDMASNNNEFVRFLIDVITSQPGACFFGKNIDGRWRFEVRKPQQ